MYVLGTNTVIDDFRGKGRVTDDLPAVPPSEVVLPAIIVYEVWVGVLGSRDARRRQTQFERFPAQVGVLPFDAFVARRAAELRRALETMGEGIGPAGHIDRSHRPRLQADTGNAKQPGLSSRTRAADCRWARLIGAASRVSRMLFPLHR